uniref:Uncharacterized protein n=1 Tax=Corethron hystrix TaxID=216773 RepID=A0A7S1BNA1_9STRA
MAFNPFRVFIKPLQKDDEVSFGCDKLPTDNFLNANDFPTVCKMPFFEDRKFIVGALTFTTVFMLVDPVAILDYSVSQLVAVLVPRRVAGETNWCIRGIKRIEYEAEKLDKEREIRSHIREWDRCFPDFHHETLVRCCSGLVASRVFLKIIEWVKRGSKD